MCFACIDGEDVRGAVGAYPPAQGAQPQRPGTEPESSAAASGDARSQA